MSQRGVGDATSVAICVIAAVVLFVGAIMAYGRREVFDTEAFTSRAVAVVHQEPVRERIATALASQAVEAGHPDLIAARPLLESTISRLIESGTLDPILSRAVAEAHRSLFSAEPSPFVLNLQDILVLARGVVAATLPECAVIGGFDGTGRDVARAAWDGILGDLGTWGLVLVGAGAVVAASGASVLPRIEVGGGLRAVWRLVTATPGGTAGRVVQVARAAAAIGLGVLAVTDADATVRLMLLIAGAIAITWGCPSCCGPACSRSTSARRPSCPGRGAGAPSSAPPPPVVSRRWASWRWVAWRSPPEAAAGFRASTRAVQRASRAVRPHPG